MSGGTLNHTGGNFYVADGGGTTSTLTMSNNAVVNAVNNAAVGPGGTGVMTVKSAAQLLNLNRDARKKMAVTKEGRETTGAIIQEGVYSFETWGEEKATAEPVVYMIDQFVVGGFYRVHGGRSNQENLNAPGSQFKPLAFATPCTQPDPGCGPDEQPNRFYA